MHGTDVGSSYSVTVIDVPASVDCDFLCTTASAVKAPPGHVYLALRKVNPPGGWGVKMEKVKFEILIKTGHNNILDTCYNRLVMFDNVKVNRYTLSQTMENYGERL